MTGYAPNPYGSAPNGPWTPPAPKPGVIPLRPLRMAEILDGAFTTVRKNPRVILVPGAIAGGAGTIATIIATRVFTHYVPGVTVVRGQRMTASQLGRAYEHLAGVGGLELVLAFLAETLLAGILAAVISGGVLGLKLTPADAWTAARPRLAAITGATLLTALASFGLWGGSIALAVGLGAALAAAHLAPLGALLIVVAVIAGTIFSIVCYVRFAVAVPAVALEGCRTRAGMRRSWRLTRGSSWRIFGILLLATLILDLAALVVAVPFIIIGDIAGGSSGGILTGQTGGSTFASLVIGAIGGIAGGTILRPIRAGIDVLLYADLRMRREGLDITLQAAAGQSAASRDQAAADPGRIWAPPHQAALDQRSPHQAVPHQAAPHQAAPGQAVPDQRLPGQAPPDERRW